MINKMQTITVNTVHSSTSLHVLIRRKHINGIRYFGKISYSLLNCRHSEICLLLLLFLAIYIFHSASGDGILFYKGITPSSRDPIFSFLSFFFRFFFLFFFNFINGFPSFQYCILYIYRRDDDGSNVTLHRLV